MLSTCPPSALDAHRTASAEISRLVGRLVSDTSRPSRPSERRAHQRHAYPHPIRLWPLDKQGRPTGEYIMVIGRNVSAGGLEFFHRDPLPHRRVIVSFDASDGRTHSLTVELLWCRFQQQYWYVNGGPISRRRRVADGTPRGVKLTTGSN